MSRVLALLPECSLAKHYRRLGFAPATPSPTVRAEAFLVVFGRDDLGLQKLPRTQLARVLRHMLARDPELVVDPINAGWALNLIGRNFAEQEPDLHDEIMRRLEQRLYREAREYWSNFSSGSFPQPSPVNHPPHALRISRRATRPLSREVKL
jgi:hypothetical protein